MRNLLKIQSLSRRIYDYFTAKWFLTAVILSISTSWFFLLRSFAKDLNMVDANNNLTSLFHYCFWPVYILALIFTILKTWADNYNQKVKNNGQLILNNLLENINASMETKSRRFEYFIEKNIGTKVANPFHEISQPRLQIENILDNLRETLATVFGINRSNIGISLAYKLNDNPKWDWICTMNVSNDVSLETLISNGNSTLNQIVKGNSNFIFYPDKTVGVNEGKYFPDAADRANDNIGSILCMEISLGRQDKHLRAILSINSNGLQFCSVRDYNSINKIENILLPSFVIRIRSELSLLYIKEVIAS